MSYQGKEMVIKELIKVVEAAPTIRQNAGNMYPYQNAYEGFPRRISQQDLDIWMKYVNSVFDISYDYTRLDIFPSTKLQVIQIYSQVELPIEQRIQQINNVILSLANTLLQYPYMG